MCCRTIVRPLEPAIAIAILETGQFRPAYTAAGSQYPTLWQRDVNEENCRVTVSLAGSNFEVNIYPSISVYEEHLGKRITAGLYFEIAAKYAEKVGGEIFQRATVSGCRIGNDESTLRLASYPSLPLSFERVCSGFQVVMLGPNHTHD